VTIEDTYRGLVGLDRRQREEARQVLMASAMDRPGAGPAVELILQTLDAIDGGADAMLAVKVLVDALSEITGDRPTTGVPFRARLDALLQTNDRRTTDDHR
jgi:hypothetical protein